MRRRPQLGLLAAAFLGTHLLFALLPALFEPWNLVAYDELIRAREALQLGAPTYDERIAYVELRDEDPKALGLKSFDRVAYARLVRVLADCEVALQVHDATFDDAVADEDGLAEAVASAERVVIGFVAGLDRGTPSELGPAWPARLEGDGDALPRVGEGLRGAPALEDASAGVGFLDLKEDVDGALRRAPLVARTATGLRPALALSAACIYLGVAPSDVVVRPGTSITLTRPGSAGDVVIPIDAAGRMMLDYVGPWEAMDHFSVSDVLHAAQDKDDLEILRERLRGRIVLIADITTRAGDLGTTPLDASYPQAGQHATALHGILTERFLREAPPGLAWLLQLGFLGVLFLVARSPRSVVFVGGAIAVVAACVATHAALIYYAGYVARVMPAVVMLLTATALLWGHRFLHTQQQKHRLRTAFKSYFPPHLVERFVRTPDALNLAGRRAELTILFSDIVGFSTLTEKMDPGAVHQMLNEYFEAMVEAAFGESGTVDKFIGDGLMVFFGDVDSSDHAVRAARAALAMQARVNTLNTKWAQEGRTQIKIRIGLNTGPVIVGNMGSARRLSYTVLGAAVNLAQRMESAAPAGGVLISERTRELIGDALLVTPVEPVHAKGFAAPVPAFTLVPGSAARGRSGGETGI